MKNSIGGLSDRSIVLILIVCTAIYSGLGLILSLAALILEVNNQYVRDYAKHILVISIISLIILSLAYFLSAKVTIVLSIAIKIFLLYVLYEAYNRKKIKIPIISYIVKKYLD